MTRAGAATSSTRPGAVPAQRDGGAPRSSPAGYGPEEFPGCESFHLPESGLEDDEGRQDGD